MDAQEIIERIMSQHWDMAACHCWICEAGRKLGYGAKSEYLSHNSEIQVGRVIVKKEPYESHCDCGRR